MDYQQLWLAFGIPLIAVLVITPFVIRFAKLIGATDKPNARKVHAKVMPRLGGLAIFLGVVVGYFTTGLYNEKVTAITLGALIIVAIGILDDKFELSPKSKLLGQLIVAIVIVHSGLKIDYIKVPFFEKFELGIWSIPITIFWIVGITNAINLIDGLDGLAAGISTISIGTIAAMAFIGGKVLILTLALIVMGSTIGFLFYNFNPAKIFMGDTGALFLGYCISVLSLLGLFKSVTLFSFIVPIIIIGVPVFDTAYAILRRLWNKQPISSPDKSHLHHRLMAMGLSHRQTVLVIYAFGILFSVSAILFSASTLWGSVAIILALLIVTELIAEAIGLVHERYSPLMTIIRKVSGRTKAYDRQ